jgi:hypothetical protein
VGIGRDNAHRVGGPRWMRFDHRRNHHGQCGQSAATPDEPCQDVPVLGGCPGVPRLGDAHQWRSADDHQRPLQGGEARLHFGNVASCLPVAPSCIPEAQERMSSTRIRACSTHGGWAEVDYAGSCRSAALRAFCACGVEVGNCCARWNWTEVSCRSLKCACRSWIAGPTRTGARAALTRHGLRLGRS